MYIASPLWVTSSCITVPSIGMHAFLFAWWRHQMETTSALLAICAGNSPVSGEFPAQRPVTQSFDVFFDLGLNNRLSKHWRGWWFETPSRPLWRQCNGAAPRQRLYVTSAESPNVPILHYVSRIYGYLYIYKTYVNLIWNLYLFLLIKLCLSLSLRKIQTLELPWCQISFCHHCITLTS